RRAGRQHCAAFGGELVEGQVAALGGRRGRLWRRGHRGGRRRLNELQPAGELGAAAVVVVVHGRLALAAGAALGAGDADVEVEVVAPIRADLAEPDAVLLALGGL